MFVIYAYIDPSNHPSVGIHGIHGVSGSGLLLTLKRHGHGSQTSGANPTEGKVDVFGRAKGTRFGPNP